jgi:FkbM family methyltransferase
VRQTRSSDDVAVQAWPRGRARIHLCFLLAGARIIRAIDPGRAWFWTSRFTVLLRGLSSGSARATFRVFGSRLITIALSDDYWIPSVALGHENEPEILAVLSGTLSQDSVFIDAGANIGWWSLFASTVIHDPAQVIAIEPAMSTFADLQENADMNDSAFTCLRAAVWNKSGEELPLSFDQRAREGAHVAWSGTWCEPGRKQTQLVPSICIDDVVDEYAPHSTSLILKLDVEGAELHALEGLGKHIDDFEMIIYEDHGKEPAARVTAEMLRLGFALFTSDRLGNISPVESLAHAQSIKNNRKRGYNFFAVRSSTIESAGGFFASTPSASRRA